MKKSLVLMALAGVALASCVNDVADVAQNEQKKALIGFQSPVIYQNATSRYVAGEISSTTFPKEESFMVAARKTAANWEAGDTYWTGFEKVSFVEAQNGWKTSTDYYWPTYQLSFVAYSPAELPSTTLAGVTYTNAGWNFDDFVVPTDQTQKIDLLYSNLITGQTSNGNNGGYYGVPVVFNHALSSIHFNVVKAGDVAEEVRLESITIFGVKNKGDFDGSAWTAAGDAVAIDYTPYNVTDGTGLVFTTTAAAVGAADANSLLLMPQDLTGLTMKVKYSVNGVEKETSAISLDNLTQNGTGTTITEWEPGHRYTYILNYSALPEDLIYFAPSVAEWADVSLTINLD